MGFGITGPSSNNPFGLGQVSAFPSIQTNTRQPGAGSGSLGDSFGGTSGTFGDYPFASAGQYPTPRELAQYFRFTPEQIQRLESMGAQEYQQFVNALRRIDSNPDSPLNQLLDRNFIDQSANPDFFDDFAGEGEIFGDADNPFLNDPNNQSFNDSFSEDLFQGLQDGALTNDNLVEQNVFGGQTPAAPSLSQPDLQNALSNIKGSNVFRALNTPPELDTGPIDVTGLVPGLGDQTGITQQAGIYAQASIYTQLQRTSNLISYLNTAPNGTQPNPEFSYIPGQPPYGKASPGQRKQQEEVFNILRQNIISQLVRIARQLRQASDGLKQSTDFAKTFNGVQDQEVGGFLKQAFAGGAGQQGG